jgi:hypothetical protein
VTLVGGIPVTNWGGNISADDFYTTINLPLRLTLYNYSTSNVSISTNGVSYPLLNIDRNLSNSSAYTIELNRII